MVKDYLYLNYTIFCQKIKKKQVVLSDFKKRVFRQPVQGFIIKS